MFWLSDCIYFSWLGLVSYSISQEICTRFLLCCALLWLYIDWFSHIHQAYFTDTAPVPSKQPWWIWINTSCEFIMNDCITTTKQSTTKPCAYFLRYTVYTPENWVIPDLTYRGLKNLADYLQNTFSNTFHSNQFCILIQISLASDHMDPNYS